ncbi:MAG: glycosyl transferase family 2 [Deltaproteobacteria bacterium]|nr:glycosyl transferase family 2 [Deltaproteobacteria bacterium]
MHQTPAASGEAGAKRAPQGQADIIVGIASYNNSKTIGHVVNAVDAGLGKYFPRERSVIINSDGGSTDSTPDAVLKATLDHKAIFLPHRLTAINRISTPYHGIPGKGSAFRAIFSSALSLGAKACCVVDADLRSITPEWIELLIAPVLNEGFDFVAPLYSRHRYDGTITNSIIYPVTRALYGRKIRQPIGGEFGFSGRMAGFYLAQDVWQTDVARFGIDIWMTTEALANRFKVCQSYLGAKIHDPKDPGADLREMFVQVVGSLFSLTEKHYREWKEIRDASDVPTFGFKYSVGVVPVKADMGRMLADFRVGVSNLKEVWERFIARDIIDALEEISQKDTHGFRFPKALWARIVYDFILASCHRKLPEEHLLKSLLPLYFGRTASFFLEVAEMSDDEAEDEVERVCEEYERQKGYLLERW